MLTLLIFLPQMFKGMKYQYAGLLLSLFTLVRRLRLFQSEVSITHTFERYRLAPRFLTYSSNGEVCTCSLLAGQSPC